jgi:hypothetical protein
VDFSDKQLNCNLIQIESGKNFNWCSIKMLRQKIDSERLLDESSRWIVTIPSAETVDAHTVSYVSNYYILLGGNSIK